MCVRVISPLPEDCGNVTTRTRNSNKLNLTMQAFTVYRELYHLHSKQWKVKSMLCPLVFPQLLIARRKAGNWKKAGGGGGGGGEKPGNKANNRLVQSFYP